MTDEELNREHLARLGDKDWYLSRDDAAVVCRAIALSMPALSWEAIKARIGALLCRFSRGGDRWMCAGSFENETRPISAAAVSYLKANASMDVVGDLEAVYEAFVKESGQSGERWLAVEELYGLLGRGLRADRFRAWMAKSDRNGDPQEVAARAQRSAFSQD